MGTTIKSKIVKPAESPWRTDADPEGARLWGKIIESSPGYVSASLEYDADDDNICYNTVTFESDEALQNFIFTSRGTPEWRKRQEFMIRNGYVYTFSIE